LTLFGHFHRTSFILLDLLILVSPILKCVHCGFQYLLWKFIQYACQLTLVQCVLIPAYETDYKPAGSYFYKVVTTEQNRESANQICKQDGGQLAVVNSHERFYEVRTSIHKFG